MKHLIVALILCISFSLVAERTDLLKELSLESLLNIPVKSSTYNEIDDIIEPSNVTVISREQISSTPARNVLDLLEVYVPGFTYVQHFMGPRMGLRGLLGDQDNSYLLLVNGKNLNLKYLWGPIHELQNKDLGDIKEIRVIHGPVSVTHGPGAIAGVIDIITLTDNVPGGSVGNTTNFNYNYTTNRASIVSTKDFSSNFYASYTTTEGMDNTKYWYTDRAHGYGWGFMSSSWGDMGTGSQAPRYLSSYLDEKEYKAQVDLHLSKHFDLWSRYTTISYPLTTQSGSSSEGVAWGGFRFKNYCLELSNSFKPHKNLSLHTKLGFDSSSIKETVLWQGANLPLEHISQQKSNFSENEFNLKSSLNWKLRHNFAFTVGTELMYEFYDKAWGDTDDDFLMSFQSDIGFAVYNKDSGFYKFYPDLTTVFDDKIDSFTYSFFGEAYYELSDVFKLIPSARMDNNEYADPAYSYRISLSASPTPTSAFILTGQESVRLPTFMNLFSSDYNKDNNADNEVLQGIELIHRNQLNPNMSYSIDLYYNNIDQVAWDSDTDAPGVLGELSLCGFDTRFGLKYRKHSFGANYSFVDQIDWKNHKLISAYVSGLDTTKVYIDNYGENRINNLPRHMFKFFDNYTVNDNLSFHFNGRFAFDYQQNEMLDVFKEAHDRIGDPILIDSMQSLIDDLEEHGYGEPSFTSGLGIMWIVPVSCLDLSLRFNVDNIISYNQIRYIIQYWEDGNMRQYPRQVGFIKEPINIAFEVTIKV